MDMSAQEQERTDWFSKNPKKTIFLFVLIVLCGVDCLTGSILIPDISGVYSAYYHHDLKRNYKGNLRWGSRSYAITTNALGFKDRERKEVAPTTPKQRILIIGDSFTEGIGYAYEKTFVGRFEGRLDGARYEVLNAGVTSYSPKLYWLKIKYLIEEIGLRFDELFVYIDISDIQDEIIYAAFEPAPNSLYARWKAVDTFLRQHFYTYRFIRESVPAPNTAARADANDTARATNGEIKPGWRWKDRDKWTSDENVYEEWGRQGLLLARAHMEKLHELCAQHGVRMSIAVYPWRAQITGKEIRSRQVTFWERFCKEKNIPFINYFPRFIENGKSAEATIRDYFIEGDNHWNEQGHQLIADVLRETWSGSRTH